MKSLKLLYKLPLEMIGTHLGGMGWLYNSAVRVNNNISVICLFFFFQKDLHIF